MVAGGGVSGVEAVAELNDFVRESARSFRNIDRAALRVSLVHSRPDYALLDDGERIPTKTLVSTVPSAPNPIVARPVAA